jgi:hypothetical protein
MWIIKKPLLVLVLVCVAGIGSASATVFLDGPFDGNSWTVRWGQRDTETNYYGQTVGPFDTIVSKWISGTSLFENPLCTAFTDPLWSPTYRSTGWEVIHRSSGSSTALDYTYNFTGNKASDDVIFRTAVYSGGVWKQAQTHGWNHLTQSFLNGGNGYQLAKDGADLLAEVPEPGTVALLGIVMLGAAAAAFGRRRRS